MLEAINTRDGLLVFIYKLNKPSEPGQVRALVPEELKEQVFLHLHVHPMSGHFGVEATKKRARTRFCYPGKCDDIAKAVTSCTACLAKTRTTDHREWPINPGGQDTPCKWYTSTWWDHSQLAAGTTDTSSP